MAAKDIERFLFSCWIRVGCRFSVIDYGLDLTTLSQSNMLQLGRVKNEAMTGILGTTKDMPKGAMQYLLNLSPVEARQEAEEVKAYLNAIHSTTLSKNKGGVDW